jgi:hypothetical protein
MRVCWFKTKEINLWFVGKTKEINFYFNAGFVGLQLKKLIFILMRGLLVKLKKLIFILMGIVGL